MQFCGKMSALKIEGDLSQISDQQLTFIKGVIDKQGFTDSKVTIQPLGQAGDNYAANVKRIVIEDGKGKSFKIVGKVAPHQEPIRQMFNTPLVFHNEHLIYTKILPKFSQLEMLADVPLQDRFRYATCYGSLDEASNEVILLEDLNESSFIMLDRMKSLSNECVKSVLKNFASFHSLSYALKYKEPVIYEEFKNSLYDIWATMSAKEQIAKFFKKGESYAASVVDKDVHKNAINGAITAALKGFIKMSTYEKDSKYAIIQQGDAWTNNIMFKFDGETLLQSILIDYQISKPTNPAADLLYMIFNCTDHQLRKQHFYDWINYYHSELDKYLTYHGLKTILVLPRDQLDADLKRYGKISFGHSVLLAGMLSVKAEEASETMEIMGNQGIQEALELNEGYKDAESVAIYKKRLEELVDSFQEFGLI